MAVFTEVSPAQLQPWLHQCGAGELRALQGIAAGIENTNYFVDTWRDGQPQRYVLTVFEKLSAAQLPFYLGLMKHLADQGIPVPAPVRQTNQQLFGELCGKPCALVTCLPGQSVQQANLVQCASMGGWLARMHLAAQDFALQQPNLRGLAWWQETAPIVAPYLAEPIRQILLDEVAAQTAYAQTACYQGLARGPVHADLFRDNVLLVGDELSGIIDFYFAGCDTWLFDVAVTVNDWCSDAASGALLLPHTQAFLQAYQQVRPFTSNEQAAWPMALRAAALRFWMSRLYDYYLPRAATLLTAKDPTHFERILTARRCASPLSLPHS